MDIKINFPVIGVSRCLASVVSIGSLLLFSQGAYAAADTMGSQISRNIVWYTDFASDRAASIDLDSMSILTVTEGLDAGPYGMELSGNDNNLWVMTRLSHFLDEIDVETGEIIDRVDLGHEPRMSAMNPSKTITVVSGRQIPAHSVIKMHGDGSNEVIQQFNLELLKETVNDFGGQNATGHPAFLNDDIYVISDRVNRQLRVYSVKEERLLQTIQLRTAMHHMLRQGNTLFWALEGNDEEHPGILKIHFRPLENEPLKKIYTTSLVPERDESDGFLVAKSKQGLHHINFHPDGRHIYAASAEGTMFVIDSWMDLIVDRFAVGEGAGHTDFTPEGLMVSTPHKDNYVTVVDTRNPAVNLVIKDVEVSEYKEGKVLQGHTQGISDDGKKFYGAATSDGILFEVNLSDYQNPQLRRTLDLDGADLRQGFMYLSPEGQFAKNPVR